MLPWGGKLSVLDVVASSRPNKLANRLISFAWPFCSYLLHMTLYLVACLNVLFLFLMPALGIGHHAEARHNRKAIPRL
jgi:hypothetical protein